MQSPLSLPPLHCSALAAGAAGISLGLGEGGCPAAAVGSGCPGQPADTSTKATTKPLPELPKAITKTSVVPSGDHTHPQGNQLLHGSDRRAGTKPCLGWGWIDFSPTSTDLSAGPPYQHKTLLLRATSHLLTPTASGEAILHRFLHH